MPCTSEEITRYRVKLSLVEHELTVLSAQWLLILMHNVCDPNG